MLLALAWLLLRARKGKNNRCGLCSVGDALLASLILFIPGFFLVRSFGYSRIESLCFAPFASALVITLLCFSYSKIGIEASFISLSPFALIACSACYGFSRLLLRAMPVGKKAGDLPLIEGKMLALYIVVAVGVLLCVRENVRWCSVVQSAIRQLCAFKCG